MDFTFTKQSHTGKTGVWYDGIFIGEIETIMKQNNDIDWETLRKDKTLKLSVKDRWNVTYKVLPSIRIYDNNFLSGAYETIEAAASAMLRFHRQKFDAISEVERP